MKGICLVSGGLDSTLALIKLLEQGHKVQPMFVDYNQWSWEGELHAVNLLEAYLEDKYPKLLLATVKSEICLDNDGANVGSVWGRGIALVGLAAMWAYTHGDDCDFIALGNHKGDVGPDCKPGDFDNHLGASLLLATKGRMNIELPVEELSTEEIGRELNNYKLPFELMYSCYWYPPCGYKSVHEGYRCPGCRRKTIAMQAAGVTNEYYLDFPNGEDRSYQSDKAEKTDY
jgi:7-cyano-7-deazaguanine synthase